MVAHNWEAAQKGMETIERKKGKLYTRARMMHHLSELVGVRTVLVAAGLTDEQIGRLNISNMSWRDADNRVQVDIHQIIQNIIRDQYALSFLRYVFDTHSRCNEHNWTEVLRESVTLLGVEAVREAIPVILPGPPLGKLCYSVTSSLGTSKAPRVMDSTRMDPVHLWNALLRGRRILPSLKEAEAALYGSSEEETVAECAPAPDSVPAEEATPASMVPWRDRKVRQKLWIAAHLPLPEFAKTCMKLVGAFNLRMALEIPNSVKIPRFISEQETTTDVLSQIDRQQHLLDKYHAFHQSNKHRTPAEYMERIPRDWWVVDNRIVLDAPDEPADTQEALQCLMASRHQVLDE